MLQTISAAIDWHVSSWATIYSRRNNPTWGSSCLFYGLIFMGHDAKGTLHRKEYLTICQKSISGDTNCWNQDIFIYFKHPSGHLLCHWNQNCTVHFKLTVYQVQMWQNAVRFLSVKQIGITFNHQDNAAYVIGKKECPDPGNQDIIEFSCIFKALNYIVWVIFLFYSSLSHCRTTTWSMFCFVFCLGILQYVSNETLSILKNKLKFDCRWYTLLPPPTALYILQRFALS